MKLFLLKSLIWILLLMVAVGIYGAFCDYFFTLPGYQFTSEDNKRAWVLGLHDVKADYAVVGSSRAYGSVDIRRMDSLTGLHGINLGANGSGFSDSYLLLYLFLKNNHGPQYLLLEADLYSLDARASFSNPFHVYQFLPYFRDSLVRNAIEENVERKAGVAWTVFAPSRYVMYNRYFSFKQVFERLRNRGRRSVYFSTMGCPPGEEPGDVWQGELKRKTLTIDSKDEKYLRLILELATKRKMTVIGFNAPEWSALTSLQVNRRELLDSLSMQFSRINAPFVSGGPDSICSRKDYFVNPTHINLSGRRIYTTWLAQRFREIANPSTAVISPATNP